MAFHNPDPKMRAIEQRNARVKTDLFVRLIGGAWRRLRKGALRLSRGKQRRGPTHRGR